MISVLKIGRPHICMCPGCDKARECNKVRERASKEGDESFLEIQLQCRSCGAIFWIRTTPIGEEMGEGRRENLLPAGSKGTLSFERT